MAKANRNTPTNPEAELQRLQAMARKSPFLLRLTRLSDMEPPVLIVKERIAPEDRDDVEGLTNPRAKTVERGQIHGEAARSCIAILQRILGDVRDDQGIALNLDRHVTREGLKRTDINLPLDEAAGARLALFFRLQSKMRDINRIELIGRRVALFSREEAVYWLANVTASNQTLRAWATTGLRTMLCGEAGDHRVQDELTRVRARTT